MATARILEFNYVNFKSQTLHKMGVDGLTINVTMFHPTQLCWIILLQSNTKFFIQSVNISSSNNFTSPLLSDTTRSSILINSYSLNFTCKYEVPVQDLSQICFEDIMQQQFNSNTFNCGCSVPSFSHQIVIFNIDYQQITVSLLSFWAGFHLQLRK